MMTAEMVMLITYDGDDAVILLFHAVILLQKESLSGFHAKEEIHTCLAGSLLFAPMIT